MPRAYLIDPRRRKVDEFTNVQVPNTSDPWQVTILTEEGDALFQPPRSIDSPARIDAYVLDGRPGVFLGDGVVYGPNFEPPTIPLISMIRWINWVSTLMVCNGAVSVIPKRTAR